MKKIELLSPAGSFEALEAAIMCGADAVYLGGTKFGARAYAANFNDEEMEKAVKYAHLYGVKIYVTVNTLIYDSEVNEFLDYISFLINIGVDAFIVQDIGMLHLLTSIYPNIEIHASTQMHIHNIESLLKLKKLGVKRAVLPREYSIDEIKKLKNDSGLDIEVFIQGALCISYSGQCLMSYLIGGRSGNRGECAGSCRLPYKLVEKNNNSERIIDTKGDYLLSTKDLYTLDNIKEIIESGADSLKIEGRMKRPEYVAIVTTLYRNAIDAYYEGKEYKVKEQDLINLKKMFNRGFTKGHILKDNNIMNPIRPNHMGVSIGKVINTSKNKITIKLTDNISIGDGIRIVSNEDIGFTITKIYKNNAIVKEAYTGDIVSLGCDSKVNIGDEVLKTTDVKLIDNLKELYKNNNHRIELTCNVYAHIDEYFSIIISDGKNEVKEISNIKVSKALNAPVTKDVIIEKLNKINDTPYIFKSFNIDMDDNIFFPLAEINSIKRIALEKMSEIRINKNNNIVPISYNFNKINYNQENIMIKSKIRTMEQYKACVDNNIDMIYIEDIELYNKLKDDKKVVLSLTRVRKNKTDNALLVSDIGAISDNTITDYALNVVNAYSTYFLHSLGANTITLSYEMDTNRIKELINNYNKIYNTIPNLEVVIYGRIEAMITEYCPINTYVNKDNSCNLCKGNKRYYLRDRFNNDYLLVSNNCKTTIYDYKKRNIINNINVLKDLGIKNFRFNFVDENYEECMSIIKEVRYEKNNN